jgi:hypothetical protein
VDPDAAAPLAPARHRDGHVRRAVRRLEHCPEFRRTPVTQRSALTASEHGRNPPPLIAQPGVTHGVHTAEDRMEPSGGDAPGNGGPR